MPEGNGPEEKFNCYYRREFVTFSFSLLTRCEQALVLNERIVKRSGVFGGDARARRKTRILGRILLFSPLVTTPRYETRATVSLRPLIAPSNRRLILPALNDDFVYPVVRKKQKNSRSVAAIFRFYTFIRACFFFFIVIIVIVIVSLPAPLGVGFKHV